MCVCEIIIVVFFGVRRKVIVGFFFVGFLGISGFVNFCGLAESFYLGFFSGVRGVIYKFGFRTVGERRVVNDVEGGRFNNFKTKNRRYVFFLAFRRSLVL